MPRSSLQHMARKCQTTLLNQAPLNQDTHTGSVALLPLTSYTHHIDPHLAKLLYLPPPFLSDLVHLAPPEQNPRSCIAKTLGSLLPSILPYMHLHTQ